MVKLIVHSRFSLKTFSPLPMYNFSFLCSTSSQALPFISGNINNFLSVVVINCIIQLGMLLPTLRPMAELHFFPSLVVERAYLNSLLQYFMRKSDISRCSISLVLGVKPTSHGHVPPAGNKPCYLNQCEFFFLLLLLLQHNLVNPD